MAVQHLPNAHPVFGEFPIMQFPSLHMASTRPPLLLGVSMISVSPIRSSHLRLGFGGEDAGRVEVLLNKAVEASGPSGGMWCIFRFPVSALWSGAASGCVFPDLGFLILWKILYATCYPLINFSFV